MIVIHVVSTQISFRNDMVGKRSKWASINPSTLLGNNLKPSLSSPLSYTKSTKFKKRQKRISTTDTSSTNYNSPNPLVFLIKTPLNKNEG